MARDDVTETRRLRAEFIYPIDHLLIDRSLLGESVAFDHDVRAIEVAFPTEPADEDDEFAAQTFDRFTDAFDYPMPEGVHELHGTTSTASPTAIVSVDVVRVSVTWSAAIADIVGKTPEDVVESISPEVDALFSMFFDVMRSRGAQPWLGLTGTRHESWRWRLFDLDKRVRYPSPAVGMSRFRLVAPESVASASSLSAHLAELAPPPFADALLADVLYFRWEHLPQAGAIAVLLSAIACEIRAKEVIRRTSGDRLEAVELLMGRSREFSGAAQMLFSQVMSAANGRSLKVENADLERDAGKLFETRNGIAHRSELPSSEKARACIETAERLFEWLGTF